MVIQDNNILDVKDLDFLSEDVEPTNEETTVEAPAETVEVVETPSPQKVVETPVEETVVPTDGQAETPIPATLKDEPVRAPNEPDWRFEHRLAIWQKQQELKKAETPQEKDLIKSELETIRKSLAQISTKRDEPEGDEETPEVAPDGDRYIRASEVNKILAEREYGSQLDAAEADFLAKHPIVKQPENYEPFFRYVAETYNINGKSPQQISTILRMAYGDLFPDTRQATVQKSAELDKKMDAVDFSGSSTSAPVDPLDQETENLVKGIKERGGEDYSWLM